MRRLDGVMLMNDTSLYALASFMVDVLSRLEPCPARGEASFSMRRKVQPARTRDCGRITMSAALAQETEDDPSNPGVADLHRHER